MVANQSAWRVRTYNLPIYMSAIQLVVFDIAGTTVRDKGNVADSFIAAFRSFGL